MALSGIKAFRLADARELPRVPRDFVEEDSSDAVVEVDIPPARLTVRGTSHAPPLAHHTACEYSLPRCDWLARSERGQEIDRGSRP